MENSDGSMVINNGKRALFTWKDIHEDLLLQEVLLLEPFQYRSGSKERGAVWSTIAENLSKSGMKVSQRSVREKFDKLVKEFKRKEAMEQRASGIEVEYTERDVAMTDIIERMNELELVLGNKKEKEKQDQATAEEMRTKATERLGQTRRRHSEESEDGELVTPERK
jgi:signal recognition particle GTPase